MQGISNLTLRVGGKVYADAAVTQGFLDLGVDGIRAFAWQVGSDAAADQVSKGNEISGIFVDGRPSRSPDEMKRNIVWEFTVGNSQLTKAVQEALNMVRQLSYSFARTPEGHIAQSWNVYINERKATIKDLENVIPGKDDVRITSDKVYARFLEAGYWASGTTKALRRQGRRGVKALSEGRKFRKNLSVTNEVVRSLKPKYKAISISNVWYDRNPTSGPQGRWPAIVFNIRKRSL
jgi:hypothetical protein